MKHPRKADSARQILRDFIHATSASIRVAYPGNRTMLDADVTALYRRAKRILRGTNG